MWQCILPLTSYISPVHAAVIAINDAIDKRVASETLVALQIPAAHLDNIHPALAVQYQEALYVAKETKSEIARNKVNEWNGNSIVIKFVL